jgi:hypothetical protein
VPRRLGDDQQHRVARPEAEVSGHDHRRGRRRLDLPDLRRPDGSVRRAMARVGGGPAPGRWVAGLVGDPGLRDHPARLGVLLPALARLPQRRLLPDHRGPTQDDLLDDAALARPRLHQHHRLRTLHPRPDGGDPGRGLHPDGAGQGRAAAPRAVPARPAGRDRPGDHDLRPRLRQPALGHDLHRADLRHRRDRPLGAPGPEHPDRPGRPEHRGAGRRGPRRGRQPVGRHRLRVPRPARHRQRTAHDPRSTGLRGPCAPSPGRCAPPTRRGPPRSGAAAPGHATRCPATP